MRRLLLPLVALAMLAGAPGSDAAPTPTHYLRLQAKATFTYGLDYGSHPDAVLNGKFFKLISYTARAIVRYDGRTASLLPGAGMVVRSGAVLDNDLTQGFTVIEGGEAKVIRKPYVCKGPGADPDRPGRFRSGTGERFVFTKREKFSISQAGLYVDPGNAVTDVGCVATESLPAHGLPPGPTFTVSPPARSRFAGTTPFSITCQETFDHDFNGEINGHKFFGSVTASVTLTPFPAAQLAATKHWLRDTVGKSDRSSYPNSKRDNCLR